MVQIQIRRILCPVDFSEASRLAVEYAAAVARWYEGEIRGLHVVPLLTPPHGISDYPSLAAMSPVLRERLTKDVRTFVGNTAGAGVEASVREGDVVDEIVREAASLRADLVVMGTRGRRGFERWILGSTTARLLRKAPCPVMTVCHAPGGAMAAGQAIFKNILCAVDFSAASLKALDYALSLAQEAEARLTVFHVVESLAEKEPPELNHFNVPEYRSLLQAEARKRLREAVPEEARNWCEIEEAVASGRAHKAILRVAEERGAGLIVMGAHGHGMFDRLSLGPTSDHVVRAATCPVLTIAASDPGA
jgi:nucleotide-binding universal stress UspA family protein